MTTVYFGDRWDAPMLDDDSHPRRVPTPVGEPCYRCGQAIEPTDRGLARPMAHADNTATVGYIHTECDMLGVLGHMYGVCRCTGYDTTTRAAALELLEELNARRAFQGMGPL